MREESGEEKRKGMDRGRQMMSLHVKSSDMEKSRIYLKRISVAMQALVHNRKQSVEPSIQTYTVSTCARASI
jgi:hypothetical protein